MSQVAPSPISPLLLQLTLTLCLNRPLRRLSVAAVPLRRLEKRQYYNPSFQNLFAGLMHPPDSPAIAAPDFKEQRKERVQRGSKKALGYQFRHILMAAKQAGRGCDPGRWP